MPVSRTESSLVEGRVCEIDVFLVHFLLGQFDGFAEALEVYNFSFTQEADCIVDVRIVGQTENIVIGKAGFLLWYNHPRATLL